MQKEKNRMPFEVKKLLELGKPVTPGSVDEFSMDDMIMYIINFLEDPLIHADPFKPPYEKYEKEIAARCANELGNWFWTIFSSKAARASRCSKRLPPY